MHKFLIYIVITPCVVLPNLSKIFTYSTVSIAGYIKKQFGMAPLVTNITDYSGNITDYSGNITDYSGNITDYSGNITDYSGNICTQLCVQFVLQPLLFMLSSCLFTGSCSDRK